MDKFWEAVNQQLAELRSAKSADDVLRILNHERNPYGDPSMASNADGFFAGSGGDGGVYDALSEAGWRVIRWEAQYFFSMVSPAGDSITYIEGDIFRGTHRAGGDR